MYVLPKCHQWLSLAGMIFESVSQVAMHRGDTLIYAVNTCTNACIIKLWRELALYMSVQGTEGVVCTCGVDHGESGVQDMEGGSEYLIPDFRFLIDSSRSSHLCVCINISCSS